MTDEELAARLAEGAGRLLMGLREQGFPSGPTLGRVADKAANAFILSALREWRPGDPILSEESPDSLERLGSDRVWIIDPLDGTREYVEGRNDWAVHVALAIHGEPRIGAVAIPALGRLFRSDHPRGSEGIMTVGPIMSDRPRMVVSRTRPPPEVEALAANLGAEIIPMGSAGAKAMAVVAGEADIYYHSGGQHEWDNCAPAAAALGAGLHASRIDGSALRYNLPDTLVPDLIIGRSNLADRVIALCKPVEAKELRK